MIEEHLRNGHQENVQLWSKDQTIFIQKANFNKDQKTSGLLVIELQLLKELTISSLRETLIRELHKSGHQEKGHRLLKDLTICILKANSSKDPKTSGPQERELQWLRDQTTSTWKGR